MVGSALPRLPLADLDLVLIENVGNLVCPAEFDVGEHARAMVYAITEGEEKPLKYPVMFRSCDLVVVNKIDLLPYLGFDMDGFLANLRAVNPAAAVIQVSARTGRGRRRLVRLAARAAGRDAVARKSLRLPGPYHWGRITGSDIVVAARVTPPFPRSGEAAGQGAAQADGVDDPPAYPGGDSDDAVGEIRGAWRPEGYGADAAAVRVPASVVGRGAVPAPGAGGAGAYGARGGRCRARVRAR